MVLDDAMFLAPVVLCHFSLLCCPAVNLFSLAIFPGMWKYTKVMKCQGISRLAVSLNGLIRAHDIGITPEREEREKNGHHG